MGSGHSSLHVWCIVTNGAFLVQVAALAKDSGPAVMRTRLPAPLSNPLMGRPPKVNPTLSLSVLGGHCSNLCDGAEIGEG